MHLKKTASALMGHPKHFIKDASRRLAYAVYTKKAINTIECYIVAAAAVAVARFLLLSHCYRPLHHNQRLLLKPILPKAEGAA